MFFVRKILHVAMLKNVVLFGCFLFASAFIASARNCETTEKCKCVTDDGDVIDLKALDGTGDQPRFTNVPGLSGFTFSYNPCATFSLGSCTNVQICEVSPNGKYDSIGNDNTETFLEGNDIAVQYTAPATLIGGQQKTSKITLICSENTDPKLVYIIEDPVSVNYFFTLTHISFCPGYGPSSSDGLSYGSILLIVVLVILIVYIVAGISFQKFYRKKEGSEIIPNKDFWIVLPGFIKDGILFTFDKCKELSTKRGQYEKVDSASKT